MRVVVDARHGRDTTLGGIASAGLDDTRVLACAQPHSVVAGDELVWRSPLSERQVPCSPRCAVRHHKGGAVFEAAWSNWLDSQQRWAERLHPNAANDGLPRCTTRHSTRREQQHEQHAHRLAHPGLGLQFLSSVQLFRRAARALAIYHSIYGAPGPPAAQHALPRNRPQGHSGRPAAANA